MQRFALGWLRERTSALVLFFLVLGAATLNARADDAPARRTVRLSYLQGNVTVDPSDNTAGYPAQINMPLADSTRLTTGEDGQAEVEFEDGSVVRLTPNTSLGLTVLSVDATGNFRTQLMVLHGLVYAELRAASKFTYKVTADGAVISPVANATVRIDLDQPPAVVSVFDGSVHVEHAGSAQADGYKTDVRAGETLTGDASDSSRYFLSPGIEQDSWDVWNQGRDQVAADAAAERTTARDGYAGSQGYGWADLDANGSWYDVPGQGQVWQPNGAQDDSFDPYGYGSWISYPGTGYVWASGYAWGWTPFRCGNWSYWNSFGWGWSPGAGCGLAGWGFGGGVYVVNILRPPLNYRLPTRPVHEPGMSRPIQVGHSDSEPGAGVRSSHEPRLIAGELAEPLRPVSNASTPKDRAAAGAALRSDFAVDPASRRPITGVAAPQTESRPGTVRPADSAAAPDGSVQQPRSPRPAPPQLEHPNYPAQTQGERVAPRPPPPAYSPRPAPPAYSPPAPRPAPTAPAPAAPKK